LWLTFASAARLLLETSIVVTLRLRVRRVVLVDQAVDRAAAPQLRLRVAVVDRDLQVLDHRVVAVPRQVRSDTT